MLPKSTARAGFTRLFVLGWLMLAGLFWSSLAMAQHTSPLCPAQSATVPNGGSVVIDVTDCNDFFGPGVGPVQFPPSNGTAVLSELFTPPSTYQIFVTYTHDGSATLSDSFGFNDEYGDRVQVNITVTPSASAIVVSPASIALQTGVPFNTTLTSTGGTAPYTYTLNSGTLPAGLTLTSGGVLSGTPTQRTGFNFTVRSQDSLGDFVLKTYGGTIANPAITATPTSTSLVQGAASTLTYAGSGGTGPYTFSVNSGTVPTGTTLQANGQLTGTPTATGTFNFDLVVNDSTTDPACPGCDFFAVVPVSINVVAAPSVSIAVSPASVSEDGATNLTYTVTRSAALAGSTVVNLTTGGTATSGVDYTGGVATVTIPGGATTATVTIDPTVDGTVEADETVILTVAAGAGYSVGAPASATGTVLNDDVPTATISVSPANVAEDGVPNLVYTVTLNQASLSATSVNYTIGGTAANGTDYGTIASPLVIPAGTTTGTITVNPTADATIEANETVALTLAAGAGYTVGVPNAATGTILNDDLPNLVINDVTANEGNAGTTNFTFTVSLSAPAGPGGVTFDIASANGTATGGVDYVANSLTGQTIPAGSSTYTFTVLVNGDALNEPSETFFVNVTNVINAVVVDGQGVGTVVNDDPLPSISINDVSVVEGNAGTAIASFQITLSAASGQSVNVNYASANGTATAPADYIANSGTLIFAPGQVSQTLILLVNGEITPEANETFFVNLSGATNATIADNQGVGTITNDDVPVTVSPGTVPNGTVAVAYSQALSASGGSAPYSFAVTAGTLPTGLTLSTGGLLSGTPTAGGTFNFTVTATDASPFPGPFSGSQAYSVTIAAPTISLPATALAGGTLGSAYSASITAASGGTAPYAYAVTAGALPGGLTLNPATGAITGTPSALGTFNFSITATDGSTGTGPYTATQAYAITVVDVPPVANNGSVTVAFNAAATNVPLNITGGAPVSVAIGTAPANGTAIATGTSITYQPNVGYAGPDSFTYTATNSGGTSAPATISVTVSDPVVTITAGGPLSGTVAAPYSQTFTFNGGSQPWSGYAVTNLPAGVSITGTSANTVTVSGTPTEAGTFSLNVSATDSSTGNGPFTVGQAFSLTINSPTLAMTPAAGTLNAPYGVAFSQAFAASGGTGPYTYAVTGTLPAGLSFSGDTLSGTPTVPGNYAISVTATDTGSTGAGSPFTVTLAYSIQVPAPAIVVNPATLPNPVAGAAYSEAITASGGVGAYGFAVTAGNLPAGLTLSGGGSLSGTATEVGTFNFTVTATDAFGQTGSRAYSFTVAAPVLTMTPAAGTLNAPYGAAYTQAFVAGGSPGPYSYVLTGTLPAGMSFSNGTLSGTPTVPGSYPVTVTATDTGLTGVGAPFSIAQAYTIDVPAPTIVVDPATLPNPVAGAAYAEAITATGGVGPYGFALTAGSLPNGLTLSAGGSLSGTATEVGTFNFTVTATDANGQTGSRAYSFTVAAPVLTMTPAAGTLNAPYAVAFSQAFTASGSPGPYTYVLTGALPAGMSFSNGTLSGTPTVPGSYPVSVTATDTGLTGVGAPFSITQAYTIDVPAPTIVVNPATLANGTAGQAYTASLSASGAVAPYGFAVTAGALPPGMSLSAGGALSGTPTSSGTFNFTVTATDANGQAGTRAYALVIDLPVLAITPATLPSGIVGVAYSQAISASGGIAPYSFAVTGGALPTGLTLAADGTLSGTPTAQGTYAFTVTATDSTGGTAATASQAYSVEIVFAPPVAVNDAATVLAGASVTIAVTANDTSVAPITSIAITSPPAAGTATVSGLDVVYTAPTISPATVTFTYTATGPGGTSAPATVTVTVNPLPIPANFDVTTTPATPVSVTLTAGATGGPFTGADVVSVSPAASGTAVITASGGDYVLTFTPAAAFSGAVVVQFTIDNAFATSAIGTVNITVEDRPDPTQDAEVQGMVDAQAETTRRFATAQIGNFQQRLERLHRGGGGTEGVDNTLGFSVRPQCIESVVTDWMDPCSDTLGANEGGMGGMGANGATGNGARSGGNRDSALNAWVGGVIRSGSADGRNGNADVSFETDGASAGMDFRVNPSLAIGVGIGYGRDENAIGDNGSRVKGDASTLASYASFHPGDRYYVDGLLGYQRISFDLRRYVTPTDGFVFGQRDGDQWFASVSTGADIRQGAVTWNPYLRLDLARATLDGYTETGDAIYALRYGAMDVDTTTGNLGLRVDSVVPTTWGAFSPMFRIEYQRDFHDRANASLQYADLVGGPVYRLVGTEYDASRWVLGLGARFDLSNDWSFGLEYRGQVGSSGEADNGLLLNVQKSY
ncbi:putative Ig domain-containing protein [Arenimonas sp.]|uniref:putative Ig domain-containing protein n=1 Tax=Arenimonas sp. TaxID=1872635 RepID=UPI002E343823|nr:putative Ig domain-containing protein [Arenimonas sp.]HEX4853076.1 putative Ig domain-containing protein [Arenimonas sp.]